ncbi:MAG: fructose-bisphosphate aldolase, partial [Pseudomonadota bacterium]|nr:fructose-bisphosphate aldolase [Pseudomonadota bacterium]
MNDIERILGSEGESLLTYECGGISRNHLHLPGPDYVSRVLADSDRSNTVLRNLQTILGHGRLGNTGYVSI